MNETTRTLDIKVGEETTVHLHVHVHLVGDALREFVARTVRETLVRDLRLADIADAELLYSFAKPGGGPT